MPDRDTKFSDDWLEMDDGTGHQIKLWCTRGKDDFHGYCNFCKKDISISNSGKIQLVQHAKTVKHKKNSKDACDPSQTKLQKLITPSGEVGVSLNRPASSTAAWSLNAEEKKVRAEILWILNVAKHNYSFLSCDGIGELFESMFPESAEAKGLKLSARKISYEISHGLGPYFLKRLVQDLISSNTFFTLMYDETLNECNKKQLDIHVRFWNNNSKRIEQSYLGTDLLHHATADNIDAALMNCINANKLSLSNLLMLGSDGPFVNKAVFKIMDKRLRELHSSEGLINIGTCNLHIVHNAFGKGLAVEAFTRIVDFLEDIDIWFRKYPSRKGDLMTTICNSEEIEENVFQTMRYVSNRWLSVVPVCKRALQLFPALKQHFITDLVDNKSPLLKNERYKRICKVLMLPLTPAYLKFLVSVGSLFEGFLRFLQSEETLVHILYDEMSTLVRKLLFRFINMDDYTETVGENLLDIPVKSIIEKGNLKYLDVGSEANSTLQKVDSAERKCFKFEAQSFYCEATMYLMEKLPLKNQLLKSLQILHPVTRKESVNVTSKIVRRLAKMLPRCISDADVDKVVDEWRIYATDDDITEFSCGTKIDEYWQKVFSLRDKNSEVIRYPYLTLLVKAALCLSHGQASVERGFSVNKRMMPSERACMSIATISGLRLIKDNVKGKVCETVVTREMIQFYKDAHSNYTEDLKARQVAQEKVVKESANSSKTSCSPAEKFEHLKENVNEAQQLIEEGNKRLETALKRKSFKEIAAAQALIEAGNKKLKTA